ncbi:hypothetical protein FOL47_011186 [Perkinsus chesapeaki]|uniref:Uncharacterized protein n=1 Tax=Perkinsus chesapeaki TaxID=330153 RepID=A0A7J6KY47_PERCH|nr:hypothetical protein FOL47_011186 [Perkinsus chesapeaki]
MLERCIALAVSLGVVSAAAVARRSGAVNTFCRCDASDTSKCTRVTFYGLEPSSAKLPRIDISDIKSGVIETNVKYSRTHNYQYYYYHITLSNEDLKAKLGPMDVDSISALGMLTSGATYLSPKMVDGRDVRIFQESNCPENMRQDPVLPRHIDIHTHEPHLPTGVFCAHWLDKKVFIMVNFVSNEAGYSVKVSELYSRQETGGVSLTIEFKAPNLWFVSIEVKDDNVVAAIRKENVKDMEKLFYNPMLKPGRDSLTNSCLHLAPDWEIWTLAGLIVVITLFVVIANVGWPVVGNGPGQNKTAAVVRAIHEDSSNSGSKYLPKAFELRNDEWCKTSWEAVDRAHRGAGTYWADEDPGMYKKFRDAPESVDGVFNALHELGDAYSQRGSNRTSPPKTAASATVRDSTPESRERRLDGSWA